MTGVWLVSYVALWILVLVLALVLVSMLRNLGTIYETLQTWRPVHDPIKLKVGEVVPALTLTSITNETVSLTDHQGTPLAVAIISPGCEPCHDLAKVLARGEALPQTNGERLIIISVGSGAETQSLIDEVGLHKDIPVYCDTTRSTAEAWGVSSTPTTVLLDERSTFVRHIVGFTGEEHQAEEVVAAHA
ncbi:MAG: hypothetical protein GFH27_549279n208 [Chloroflexi bacterium AL-W]|nr:hypothetical protein [Chloroflexi bacterium AL-N1]NOK65174.1 hypothetical protein [Chloroflexi bacterium AL-N10]NOK72560.1 hypothetical protein [Chloroflexi bacterium AL-N5]NOK79353.1 hypothetical protein [Chloroflexi bacterium AL-W]NOK87269.1 hypothetical protein [Chloroflexi bacterium AL-N15]